MNRLKLGFFVLALSLSTAPALGCNFCSSKPKTLSNGLAQEPGSASTANNSANNSNRSQGNRSNAATEPFKQNPNGGQTSSNPKWSSSDFFESR
jgi:hypothetical protein